MPISGPKWRRGRDSNPRWACTHAAFRVRCIRPLCHLSGSRGRARRRGRHIAKQRRRNKTQIAHFRNVRRGRWTPAAGGVAARPLSKRRSQGGKLWDRCAGRRAATAAWRRALGSGRPCFRAGRPCTRSAGRTAAPAKDRRGGPAAARSRRQNRKGAGGRPFDVFSAASTAAAAPCRLRARGPSCACRRSRRPSARPSRARAGCRRRGRARASRP